ncbi:hypothetical protein B2G94_10155 [Staphylococcus hominis subsp. hominis]|uniref:hypothetical protein n=1 Tax=Staphylococcus hominis TaxID=1290 RepID=UPI000B3B4EBC|nr:hypothetical protein [Staphylococcus hominis]AUJ52938.1 hypothetical protein B7P03_10210 [Staphylococcus hominis subsp. hominis]OUL45101.1 hypothetical protein B2G94_10155 [Staphylococcus hominis subsp. hominis]
MDNTKRLLTIDEKQQLNLDKPHLFFWETDLFLIAKSAMNIAYTLTENDFKQVHLECLKHLHKALELELKTIKIDDDYYAYDAFIRKLFNFVNIFSQDQGQSFYQKKVEFFQVLLDTFRQLPVVDFGDATLSNLLT